MTRSLVITKLVVPHLAYRTSSHTALAPIRMRASHLSQESASIATTMMPRMIAASRAKAASAKYHQWGWTSSATVS